MKKEQKCGKGRKKMSIYAELEKRKKQGRLEEIQHIGKCVIMNYLGPLANKKCLIYFY